MNQPTLLAIDTLDDRREIWHLLHRLRPDRRLAFMDWACAQVHAPGGGGTYLRVKKPGEKTGWCGA